MFGSGWKTCGFMVSRCRKMSDSNAGQQPAISELFFRERWPSSNLKRLFLVLYAPFGALLLIFRMCIGVHIFLTACVLRKTMLLRCAVLRVMSCILGVVVISGGPGKGWDRKTRLIVANHVTSLDHMAIDLIEPCILPSVWDIPNMLRWLMGYSDLGAREGRSVLVRKARAFCETNPLPLLAFPEGAMTSGQKGLLKFSAWPFEVSDVVQPVLLSVHRPLFALTPSVLGGSWWQDVLYFLFVPFTIIKVSWLPPMRRLTSPTDSGVSETADEFAKRVATTIASQLGIVATTLTSHDAVDEAKRHLLNRRRRLAERSSLALNSSATFRNYSRRGARSTAAQLDNIAMRIKQAFPAVSLLTIRDDLERTQDGNLTCEKIAKGLLKNPPDDAGSSSEKVSVSSDSTEWRKLYNRRKWNMIEMNRAKYLQRMGTADDAELLGLS